MSAFLPWVSFLGIVGGHLPAGYFFVFGAVGCVLAYFGVRALQGRVTRAIMTTLWVLAALAALVAMGVFAEGQNLARQSFGTVSPASGFYVGLVGLVATVAGIILLQTTRRSSRQASSAVQCSYPRTARSGGTGPPGTASRRTPRRTRPAQPTASLGGTARSGTVFRDQRLLVSRSCVPWSPRQFAPSTAPDCAHPDIGART